MRFVVDGHRLAMARIAGTAYVGGLAEALFLVIATRTAFAIADGDDRVGLVAGKYLSVGATLGIALSLVVVRGLLAAATVWQSARLATRIVALLRIRLSKAFLRASWAVQQRTKAGSLQELNSTYIANATNMMNSLNTGVAAFANIVALLGLAVAVDPLGAVLLVLSVLVLGSVLRPIRKLARRRGKSSAEAGMELATSISEVSELGLELHVFRVQDAALGRVTELVNESRRQSQRLSIISGLTTPLYVGLAYAALIGALGLAAAAPGASLASLGASMLVMLRSLSYGQAIQSSWTYISAGAPVMEELARQLEVLETGRSRQGGESVDPVRVLEARSVSFSYLDDTVLRDVSFEMGPNEVIGIVGPSGSGKSTLVQLLLGLREPQEGAIVADGRDIRELDQKDWASRVTFVPQETHLVTGSVADNIRFLRDGVTQEDVERAARMAHIHEEIIGSAGGYERRLGKSDSRLSGGQQQRLSIARALIEAPDVLILDEPTSALDVKSEHLIRTMLDGLREKMTVVVIAHRLSTLDICDRILVIQDGEVVGFDTPSELGLTNDFFREAVELSKS